MKVEANSNRNRQRGIALFELLAAITIVGLISTGAAAAITQTVQQTHRVDNDTQAIQEAEMVGYWIAKDALTAQGVTTGATGGFPVTLSWQDLNNNDIHATTYTLTGGKLERTQTLNGANTYQNVIASDINSDPNATFCTWANGTLNLEVTVKVGMSQEARNFQIKIRVDQPS